MWWNCFQKRCPEKSLVLSHSWDMQLTLISVLMMLFTLRGTRAQTVTQPEDHVSVSEGFPVQLKCNYSYSGSPVLFWYVQYPKQGPQLLLKHISGESIKGFTAELNKGEASFHMRKSSAQEEDSATYYCALSDTSLHTAFLFNMGTSSIIVGSAGSQDQCRVNSQQEGNPQILSIQEGDNATMNCSYKMSTDNLQWYRQDSGRGPALLILIRSNEREKHSGRLRATLDISTKSSSLSIMASQVSDTAAYFCATNARCSPDTCSPYTNPAKLPLKRTSSG
ncbi:PREDICTED: uncharacterized protein LOC103604227 [Galeopterus variegatus]|uniref:Uncharacterized protein LOC103604227 n=1 Tax=Galeopterus variegatus TaxID=482537 RepID=A0ABM0S2C8_GALVR|nr:PREDICTED: uncharacterized protein LOC103604227 [Galeopterus variegatus]